MKKIIIITVMGLSISLSAQKTLKRYHSLKSEGTTTVVTMTVSSATTLPTEQTSNSKTAFDLSDHGQAAILTGKSITDATDLLNKKFGKEDKSSGGFKDLSSSDIQITFSIIREVNFTKKSLDAYDRIEDLQYKFEIDPKFSAITKFTKWNKYITEYGSLDVGSLEYNRSFTASLGLEGEGGVSHSNKDTRVNGDNTTENATTFGPKVSGTANVGYSNSSKETQLVKDDYIQLTGQFSESNFSIHQQGVRNKDIAGNVSIALTVKLPTKPRIMTILSNLIDPTTNLPVSADKVKMNHTIYMIPDVSGLPNGLQGTLTYTYVVRHIVCGARTFAEFDDKIQFLKGNKQLSNVTLIKKEELEQKAYFIQLSLPNGQKPSLEYVENSTGKTMQFNTYDEAVQFEAWLFRSAGGLVSDLTISGQKLQFGGLSFSDKTVKDNFNSMTIVLVP